MRDRVRDKVSVRARVSVGLEFGSTRERCEGEG